MQRWIKALAVVLGVQIALALALAWRGNTLSATAPAAPLIGVELKDVERVAIDGPATPDQAPAARVELVKRDGRWYLPGYFDAPADAAKLEDLLKRLADSKRTAPVATTAAALQRFRVADNDYERRIVLSRGENPLVTLYLGTTTGLRRAHVRAGSEPAVYAVDLPSYDVRAAAADWLDQGLLKRDTASLTEVTIAAAGKTLTLRRSEHKEGDKRAVVWEADGEVRVDAARAAALAEAIANLKVDAVLGTEARPEWRQDQPQVRLTLKDVQGRAATWTISKPKSGDTHVLKASDRPWYLELKSWNARPLLEAAAPDKLVVAANTTANR